MNQKEYYFKNSMYTRILESQDLKSFKKYITFMGKNSKKILDVGCGTGIIVDIMEKKGKSGYGVDISKTSLDIAMTKKGNYTLIDDIFPFNDEFFDTVGSYNVLEHVEKPEIMINEMIRVLAKNGKIIIGCPNFLSITNNYHNNTTGLINKLSNFFIVIKKLTSGNYENKNLYFKRLNPVYNEKFRPDCDAINLTNPLDIIRILKSNGIRIIYFSGDSTGNKNFFLNDIPFCRLFFGSIFIVGVKK